jgi:transposase-like protein
MYSYEDRIRAVRLYIKLGKSLAATVRQLSLFQGVDWLSKDRFVFALA